MVWGFGFSLAVTAVFALFGPALIDIMTASPEVRRVARDFLLFVILSPMLAVFAFAYDGVYIGATWARDMRNLMVLSLLIFLAAWFALRSFGNAGLWGAFLVHYAARGGLEALRYPALLRKSIRVSWRSPDGANGATVRGHNYFTGQSSAVIVAASAPTISDSESRPVRSKVEARSFLMSSTSPRPL